MLDVTMKGEPPFTTTPSAAAMMTQRQQTLLEEQVHCFILSFILSFLHLMKTTRESWKLFYCNMRSLVNVKPNETWAYINVATTTTDSSLASHLKLGGVNHVQQP